jgi:4-diphosphocytidyl-2-C-methyl-D-erythritol kinase
VLRAARLLASRAGLRGGARFTLTKRIPARAGLGGGSADAAAALVGLARLHGLALSRADRIEMGAALGSDVPFAATGGTALGTGRGERLRPLRLARPFRAVIAVPAWRVSTANAFARIDRGKYGLTGWGAKLRFGQSLGREGVTTDRALRLGNTFESVLGRRRSDFDSLRERLRLAGVIQPRLSGSGSSVFGILEPGSVAASVVDGFRGPERLFVVRSARGGIRVTTSR